MVHLRGNKGMVSYSPHTTKKYKILALLTISITEHYKTRIKI
jgi:hypothetical protein